MRKTRLLIIAAGVVAAVVLFLVLRPDDEDSEVAAPATTPATTGETGATAPTSPPPRASRPRPSLVTIRVTIRDGRPDGGIRRVTVAQGRRVRLVVRADVSDHVHVHGYDVFRDVAPSAPAQLIFRASIPGQFEVELEDRGVPIAEIEVRP